MAPDDELSGLLAPVSSNDRMHGLLRDPNVTQVAINRFDRVFYDDQAGTHKLEGAFANNGEYLGFLNQLLRITDVGYEDVATARTSVIEGSFDPLKTTLHGSIHIATKEVTRGDPILTVRKQPQEIVTLDDMVNQGMLSPEMRVLLEQAVRGRSNILISGGTGAGKTTLARALSWYIDPSQRVLSVEEIDELHLYDRLPNVAALTTHVERDADGRVLRGTTLEDLVREALRMRASRIWVGETRGREAYALVKACNSGHDGSVTTLHADDSRTAIDQLVSYMMEGQVTEDVARRQVANAFHLCVQIQRARMGRRIISEIVELDNVQEGKAQRINPIYKYDFEADTFVRPGVPGVRLTRLWAKYGVVPAAVGPVR